MRLHAPYREGIRCFLCRLPAWPAAAVLALYAAAAPPARAAEGSGAAWLVSGRPVVDITGGHSGGEIEGANGAVLDEHPTPTNPTNCVFGDTDRRSLYVTGYDGCLYRARTDRQG